jgi:hypothetical protein
VAEDETVSVIKNARLNVFITGSRPQASPKPGEAALLIAGNLGDMSGDRGSNISNDFGLFFNFGVL